MGLGSRKLLILWQPGWSNDQTQYDRDSCGRKSLGGALSNWLILGANLSNSAIIGAQWGDEGKGKVVDILAPQFDYVVRFQGGHNAGHTVVFKGERFALHVMPSGIFNPKTINVIANGVVVEPNSLVKELRGLRDRGVSVTPDNLKISDRAHIILPYHGILDRHRDSEPGQRKIGTTGRGIGPSYEWKASRRGIRFCDIKDRAALLAQIEGELAVIHQRYREIAELASSTAAQTLAVIEESLNVLEPFVVDAVTLLAEARDQNKTILFEGAQAALLDIDFGTYPYVTSSNSCGVGITAGAGVPPTAVNHLIGIFKAYTTRVGEGPFPTELHDETGDEIRKAGVEFGTTTGRPRRCGWLDLVALKYARRINGFNTFAMMKMDVLDGLDEIRVCTSYELNGQETDAFPASLSDLSAVKPNYATLPGWKSPTTDITNYDDLPALAKDYISFIEKNVGCPIGLVSVGPDREQTIIRDKDLF